MRDQVPTLCCTQWSTVEPPFFNSPSPQVGGPPMMTTLVGVFLQRSRFTQGLHCLFAIPLLGRKRTTEKKSRNRCCHDKWLSTMTATTAPLYRAAPSCSVLRNLSSSETVYMYLMRLRARRTFAEDGRLQLMDPCGVFQPPANDVFDTVDETCRATLDNRHFPHRED